MYDKLGQEAAPPVVDSPPNPVGVSSKFGCSVGGTTYYRALLAPPEPGVLVREEARVASSEDRSRSATGYPGEGPSSGSGCSATRPSSSSFPPVENDSGVPATCAGNQRKREAAMLFIPRPLLMLLCPVVGTSVLRPQAWGSMGRRVSIKVVVRVVIKMSNQNENDGVSVGDEWAHWKEPDLDEMFPRRTRLSRDTPPSGYDDSDHHCPDSRGDDEMQDQVQVQMK